MKERRENRTAAGTGGPTGPNRAPFRRISGRFRELRPTKGDFVLTSIAPGLEGGGGQGVGQASEKPPARAANIARMDKQRRVRYRTRMTAHPTRKR